MMTREKRAEIIIIINSLHGYLWKKLGSVKHSWLTVLAEDGQLEGHSNGFSSYGGKEITQNNQTSFSVFFSVQWNNGSRRESENGNLEL